MRSIEEIKEEYATEKGFNNWDSLLFFWTQEDIHECNNHINEISKRYALEVAKEALKNASENADTIEIEDAYGSTIDVVDKQSILSETNIPELK